MENSNNLYNDGFLKLCKEINFVPTDVFQDVDIKKVDITTKDNQPLLNIELETITHLPLSSYLEFKKAIEKRFKSNVNFDIKYTNVIYAKERILEYFLQYIVDNKLRLPLVRSLFTKENIEINLNTKQLTISNLTKDACKTLKKVEDKILSIFHNIGFNDITLKFVPIEEDNQDFSNYKKAKIDNIVTDFIPQQVDFEALANNKKTKKYNGKSKKHIQMSIKSALESYEEYISVVGEIYKIDKRLTKTGKNLYSIDISDYEEAIRIIYFTEPNQVLEVDKGDTIIVNGRLTTTNYGNKEILCTTAPIKTESLVKLKKDNAPIKRIELAARTIMSTQDGISKPSEYIDVAKNSKINAIAITDLDSVQSFPVFEKEAKANKIKPIYGVTLSSITTSNDIFYGYKDFNLKKAKYIVFDLETTGLSARFNEVIEFGAIVIDNGIITEHIQFFLKPSKHIPKSITDITKITDDDVKDGLSQEEGIKKIYELLNGNIGVAHNANFDINICKQNFTKYGLDISQIYCVDTLAISWFLFPDERKHNLNSLCNRFNINYTKSAAHRADYDAEVLANCWLGIINKLNKEYKIKTSEQLNDVDFKESLGKKFSYEIRMLAKNQAGIKKMFKYVSESLTTNYNNGPKFYIDKWKKDNDLLLGSGTHSSYLWEQVINGSDENILKAIAPFDYIELPPISTFNYLYLDDWITLEQIQWAYKDLIEKAKKLGKVCVAVCDCRYVYDYQKLIYDIYVNTPGLGGKIHWMKENRKICRTNFQYLTTTEMLSEFSFLNNGNLVEDIVVNNTHKIANMIDDNIEIIKKKLYVPNFDNSDKKLKDLVLENAKKIYGDKIDERIKQRIEKELNSIIKYGYSVIYWISHKLVKKSNIDGYIVGSRGSVGSSIVAYLAEITEVNPLEPHYLCPKCKYFEWSNDPKIYSGWDLPDKKCPKCNVLMKNDGHNIPFETFLGFEADKVPDIDLNFSGEYQPTIHNYVKELFGDTHTLRAGTIASVASKTAYGFCKKYLETIGGNEDQIWSRTFLDFLSYKAEGVKRTTGQHPGGIIIIPKEFDPEDFTPVNYPANDITSSWMTSHFDFRSIHDNVLKLDLLGHDDPTIVKMLEDLTHTKIENIPRYDKRIIQLFNSTKAMNLTPDQLFGETTGAYGLPEFGTNFVRKMLKSSKPESFNDLILLSGLSHGTNVWTGNAEELIKVGKKLNECICCRDDIMRTLIETYFLDKLMAFKIMESVRKGKGLTEEQEKTLIEHNVPDWYIDSLKKIEYMFPKAHATAYVIMAWRIAWYKIYYPLQFYAAHLSTKNFCIDVEVMAGGKQIVSSRLNQLRTMQDKKDPDFTTKDSQFIPVLEITQELYARGFKVTNPDLYKSNASAWAVDEKTNTLIPPFAAIEGLGDKAADSIVSARKDGEFLSIEDLVERTKLNSKNIESLKKLHVLDDLNETNQASLF